MSTSKKSISLASKLAIVVLGGFTAILVSLVIVAAVATERGAHGQATALARSVHSVLRALHESHGGSGAAVDAEFLSQVQARLDREGSKVDYGLVVDGRQVPGGGPADAFESPGVGGAKYRTAVELRAGVKTFRYLAPLGDDAPGVLVSIAFPIDVLRSDTRNLTLVSVTLLGGVMIAVGLLVFFTVRRATERLAKLTRTVAGLAEKDDLTLQIEVSGNDEVAAVAAAFAKLIERMRLMLGALNQASLTLSQAGANLNESSQHQQTIVARQAAAIQESLVTAEEIKRTSVTAAERAEGVLRVAEQALKAGEEGELSIQQSLSGLADIRAHVGEIAERITQLSTRTQQISGITGTVKDLADSSNMLALNAAIEAVRSGEHGKGFGVVAREIRSLADQSIQATKQVREILEDIRGAIQTAVAISEQGSARIESGLVQMRASGETLRSLAGTVKENSSAARQIAAAVSQQNAGIVQIFSALTDQSKLTEESLKQLEETSAVAGEMEEITNQVTALVRQYRV